MTADLTPVAATAKPHPSVQPSRGSPYTWRNWSTLVIVCVVVVVNVLIWSRFRLPVLGPALGFTFLVLQPLYLLYTTSLLRTCRPAERVGFSLGAVLLALMLVGLVANTLLPYVGINRPLGPIPVLIMGDALTVGLFVLRLCLPAERTPLKRLEAVERAEVRILVGSALCVVLAVFGANRLNNGAGDQVSLAGLAMSVIALLLLLHWRRQIRDTIRCAALYLISLSLLLMTSLRGWYITGHDIQTEFRVFQLAESAGRWNISTFHNTYNACLSITILPTQLGEMLRIDNPYVYKLFFQILFAICPVLVYVLARRHWGAPISILAAIYFIGFPTFFTDMPFLIRQEIGLLFVCLAMLAVTADTWSIWRRRLTFLAACIGVEVSHYSSVYILLGILSVAWVAKHLAWPRASARARRPAHANASPWASVTSVVGGGSIVVVAAIAFGWGSLATQTTGALVTDAETIISGVLSHSANARSGSVAESLLFWKTPSRQEVLNQYAQQAIKTRRSLPVTAFMPRAVVTAEPLHIIQPTLPPTPVGRLLADAGIPVVGLNSAVRLGAAEAEQLFVGIGLIAILVTPTLKRRIGREFFYFCVGSVVVLIAVTVLPGLSVDYGVLRVFQEALILIAPVLVAGSITIFGFFGSVWASRISIAVAAAVYISTTGLLPQVLGGYVAQLSLNNNGPYYDAYYTHPQEAAADIWLSFKPGTLPSGVQAPYSQNRFLFTGPAIVTSHQFITDAFPLLARPHSWIILDYSTIHTGLSAMSYNGDLIFYRYPIGFLRKYRNLVYDNGSVEIYR